MRHRHPLLRALATIAAAVVAIGLAACGVPADDEPRAITREEVPQTTQTTVDTTDGANSVAVLLWFTRSDRDERNQLVPVQTEVTAGESGDPTPAVLLDALFAGVPDDADAVSQIPPGTALASRPRSSSGLLTVDLNDRISTVQGDGSLLAYGQMVCTVDGLDDVDGVRFTIEGEPVEPANGDGEAVGGPLTCEDYASRRIR